MSAGLVFRLRDALPLSIEVSALIPSAFTGKSVREIETLSIVLGKHTVALAELFAIEGDNTEHLIFENASERLLRIGAGLDGGKITVHGNAGDEIGFAMQAGDIEVRGHSGHFTGCEMAGGSIRVTGNVGDFLGASLPGNKQGMRGGLIHVQGSAGDRSADRMRRGLIFIEGDAGAYLGARMLAGTVFVRGEVGAMPGLALKRGSLILSRSPPSMPAYFNDCGTHTLPFLALIEGDMRGQGALAAFLPVSQRVRRWCGDLSVGATGEILVAG